LLLAVKVAVGLAEPGAQAVLVLTEMPMVLLAQRLRAMVVAGEAVLEVLTESVLLLVLMAVLLPLEAAAGVDVTEAT